MTGGAFDITTGPLSKIWGFTRRAGAIPSAEDLAEALEHVGTQHLMLNAEPQTVEFSRPGISINLGAIGKGYALDRCAERFAAAGINDVLLHGGSSSVLARGSHGATPGEGWAVGVRNPLRPEHRLGELKVSDQALATSGSGSQFFIHNGQRYGHILDPRSGWPAQGVLSTTVIAPTAAMADALSTAFYVMGPVAAEQFCNEHTDIAALMVCPGERAGSLVLHGWNVQPDQWRPAVS
jgi:FAD:protein FMN transferase